MGIEQWILIGLIVLLVIAYPILVSSRNKKENQRMQQQTNSLKRGDKVMLTSGVFGKIVDLEQEGDRKLITIETGSGKNKGYMTVDAYAVYQVITDAPAPPAKTDADAAKVGPNADHAQQAEQPTATAQAETMDKKAKARSHKKIETKSSAVETAPASDKKATKTK